MAPTRISVILFDGFELLDVFGPVEVFSKVDGLAIDYLTLDGQPARSSQGAVVNTDGKISDLARTSSNMNHDAPVLLIPGGQGTRALTSDQQFLSALRSAAEAVEVVVSVCTGSAVVAAAGLLEGYSATSNKRAFDWASGFGECVAWQRTARWVHDRDRWTSSGVAAGMDMAVAFVAHYFGEEIADTITRNIELRVSKEPSDDPFA